MLGEWRSLGNPCTGASQIERLLTYFAQATHVIPYRRHPGSFIMMADRWMPDDLGSSRSALHTCLPCPGVRDVTFGGSFHSRCCVLPSKLCPGDSWLDA